jgi:hypothetical protein
MANLLRDARVANWCGGGGLRKIVTMPECLSYHDRPGGGLKVEVEGREKGNSVKPSKACV